MEYIDDALRDFQRALTFRYLLYIQYGTLFNFLAWLLQKAYGTRGQKILEGLTAGEPQVTMELNEKLIELARGIQTHPNLAAVIINSPAGEIPDHMQKTAEGISFMAEFTNFLAKYGDREINQGLGGLAAPTLAGAAGGRLGNPPRHAPGGEFSRRKAAGCLRAKSRS